MLDYQDWLNEHMANGGEYVDADTFARMHQIDEKEIKDQISRGFGDTVAKILEATKINKLADLYTKITGLPCNCKGRQELLNKLLPYGVTEKDV